MEKEKKKRGCLIPTLIISLIFLGAIAFGIMRIIQNPDAYNKKTNDEESENLTVEDWIEFDEQSWEDFVRLYSGHTSFVSAIDAFGNGQGTSLDFYEYCNQTEEFFQKMSLSLNYGETEEQKTYLQSLNSIALSDQSASKNLMNYLDSGAVSDMSKAKDDIAETVTAISIFAENRSKLLVKAGLSEEEIKQKIESDLSVLEK